MSRMRPSERRKKLLSIVAQLVAQSSDASVVPRQVVRAATAHGHSLRQTLYLCMRVVQRVKHRIALVQERDPSLADDLQTLSYELQLSAAAVLTLLCTTEDDVDRTLRGDAGRRAFDLALSIEAKIFLSQPVLVSFVRRTWDGKWSDGGWLSVKLVRLLLQLPLVLVVAICPPLEQRLEQSKAFTYYLSSPAIKFAGACQEPFSS